MIKLFLPIILLLGCISCSEIMQIPGLKEEVRVLGSISGDQEENKSRTSISGLKTVFISGDQIGVSEASTGRNNVPFSYNGSVWSTATPMYWANGTSTHTFHGYYPYNASSQGVRVSIPILNGQTFGSTPDLTCDMLVAEPVNQARTTGVSVPFTFSHAFAVLQFNIKAPLLSLYTLKDMTLTAGNTANGTNPYGIVNTKNDITQVGYNLSSNNLFLPATGNTSTNFAQSINKTIQTTGVIGTSGITVYAIVLPGQYSNPVPSIIFHVTYLIINTTTKSVNLSNTSFAPGRIYTYDVQIGGSIVRSAAAEVEPVVTVDLVDTQPLAPKEYLQINRYIP